MMNDWTGLKKIKNNFGYFLFFLNNYIDKYPYYLYNYGR